MYPTIPVENTTSPELRGAGGRARARARERKEGKRRRSRAARRARACGRAARRHAHALCAPNDHPSSASRPRARARRGARRRGREVGRGRREHAQPRLLERAVHDAARGDAPCAAPSTSAEEMPCARRVATRRTTASCARRPEHAPDDTQHGQGISSARRAGHTRAMARSHRGTVVALVARTEAPRRLGRALLAREGGRAMPQWFECKGCPGTRAQSVDGWARLIRYLHIQWQVLFTTTCILRVWCTQAESESRPIEAAHWFADRDLIQRSVAAA